MVSDKMVCTVIAIGSILLVVIALLINKKIIKCQKKWISVVALILAALMTIPYINVLKEDYGEAEHFEWSEIILNEVVPETHNTYVNHPETLVVNDHNGFATEFTTTDLDDALELRDTKNIKEY